MQAVGSTRLSVRVAEGEVDPIQGWHSEVYGQKEPAPTVIYETEAPGPVILVSLLTTIGAGSDDPKLVLRFDEDSPAWGDRVLVKVSGPDFDDRICMPNPDRLSPDCFPADALWIERGGEAVAIL